MKRAENGRKARGAVPPGACRKEDSGMPRGVIKFFNDLKGYGFIESDSRGAIYVHHSSIRANGYKSLREGEEVWFDVVEGQEGVEAVNVRKI